MSVVYTMNGTEWPYMCWSAVKQLLTHSLTGFHKCHYSPAFACMLADLLTWIFWRPSV